MKTRANRLVSMLLAGALCLSLLAACAPKKKELTRYSTIFYDVFDTVTQVIAYCESEEEFKTQMDALHADLVTYNQLYDIYHNTDILKTIRETGDFTADTEAALDKAVDEFRATFVTSEGKPLVEKKPDTEHAAPIEQEKIVAGEK